MIFYTPSNQEIANAFERIGALLAEQNANPHRVRAYRRAAQILSERKEPVSDIVLDGHTQALEAIPGIGSSLTRQIEEIVRTGKSSLLQRLQGNIEPENLFAQVPGIGEKLAHKIVEQLHIHSLEGLEQVAHDGRLGIIEGFGKGRVDLIKIYLAGLLNPSARKWLLKAIPKLETSPKMENPSVATILEMDDEYLEKAAKGVLEMIAPTRFNPYNEAWLPIYHTQKEGWNLTALFSNTARAHDLEKTDDWVIVFFDNTTFHDQVTVVTETSGPLKGKRVIRGLEAECSAFYTSKEDKPPSKMPSINPLI